MKIDRQYLQKRLEEAKPGLADKEIIEQSTSFVFVNGYLVTFNDEVAISFESPFGTDVEGAVPAKELMGLLAKFKEKEIDVYSTENELRISGKNKQAGLAIAKDMELPMADVINFDPDSVEWISLADDTIEGIKFCLFSVSQNVNKPILNCVHLSGDLVESCDNWRITRYYMDKVTFPDPILIQEKNAKILPNYPSLSKYTIYDGWAHFSDNENNFVVSCRILEEKYPDVGQFIVKGKTTIKFPEGVDDVLKRADVIIDHSKIDSEKVNVNVEKDKTIIHCDGPMGWFKETIKSKGLNNVDSIEFSINPSFLKQILGLMSHAKVNNKAAVMNFTGDKFVHIVSLLT